MDVKKESYLKSELTEHHVYKALETIACWCFYHSCVNCPLLENGGKCSLITHIPQEYKGWWAYRKEKK